MSWPVRPEAQPNFSRTSSAWHKPASRVQPSEVVPEQPGDASISRVAPRIQALSMASFRLQRPQQRFAAGIDKTIFTPAHRWRGAVFLEHVVNPLAHLVNSIGSRSYPCAVRAKQARAGLFRVSARTVPTWCYSISNSLM
jgi:hypothetical protein